MSHVAKSTVKMADDPEAIRLAIEPYGGELRVAATFKAYYAGAAVGMNETGIDNTCVYAIKFPGITYEVGLKRNDDGSLSPAYDGWGYDGSHHDGHKLEALLGGPDLPRIGQEYGCQVTLREMARKGFRTSRGVDQATGKIQAICWR